MILAVKTTASTSELWLIVVVAVGCLAIWLYMVEVYATRRDPRRYGKETPGEQDSPLAGAAGGATERILVALQGLRPRAEPDPMAAGEPGAGQPERAHAEAAESEGSPPAEVDEQRGEEGVIPWALPAQRQSPTDQPTAADPRRGRRGGEPPEQDLAGARPAGSLAPPGPSGARQACRRPPTRPWPA